MDAEGQRVIYQGDALDSYQLSMARSLLVKRSDPSAATIAVEVDPDGVDTDLTDPPCVRDPGPNAGWSERTSSS